MPALDNTYLKNLVDHQPLIEAILDRFQLDPDTMDFNTLYNQTERLMLAKGKEMRAEMEGSRRDRGAERTAANALNKIEKVVKDASGEKRPGRALEGLARTATNDLRSKMSAAYERMGNARDSGYLR